MELEKEEDDSLFVEMLARYTIRTSDSVYLRLI